MASPKNNDLNGLHRLPGTDEQQEGGLIIKKKTQPIPSDDQHVFKVPKIPPSTSSLGLDKLAAEQRRSQSSSKRFKTSSSFDENDDDNLHKTKSRNLREQRVETPSSTRSSHHDYYDKSRPAPKHIQRGLAYGNEGNKQRRLLKFIHISNHCVYILGRYNNNNDDDDDRYATPNIRGSRGNILALLRNVNIPFFAKETPSRAEWDDEDSDRRRSQWEYPTPNDSYNRRRQRDTDYYNR
jgi:hypothetical protein